MIGRGGFSRTLLCVFHYIIMRHEEKRAEEERKVLIDLMSQEKRVKSFFCFKEERERKPVCVCAIPWANMDG